MRLHVNFDMATAINHVGRLALVGTAEKWNTSRMEDDTVVTFLLVTARDAVLPNFCPQGGFDGPYTQLLQSIFVGEGVQVMDSPTNNLERFLIFTRKVEGKLRNLRKFLRATAKKLYKEWQHIEDCELAMQELDSAENWVWQQHYAADVPMPNFTQPRHNDVAWCASEFVDIAKMAMERMSEERPRIMVAAADHRRKLVEQVIQGQNPDPCLNDIVAYVSDVSLTEEHREAVMFSWLTGYGSAPKLN